MQSAYYYSIDMYLLSLFFVSVFLFANAQAAIGPVADVHIVNKNIAPDGFTRPCVDIPFVSCYYMA